ncbi:MAG: 2-dehydropantoate 2-reductase [Pseudomonadota bacterium]
MSTLPSPISSATWHVLGVGAIGGLWALRLAGRRLPVVLLGRSPAPFRQLVLEDGGTRSSEIFDQATATACGTIRHLLLATKAHVTATALAPFLPALAAGAVVVLLQNGMGAEDLLRAMRPDLRLLVAVTTDGVFRPAPDRLVLAGRGDTWLGALNPEDDALARATAEALGMGHAPDIQARRWLKLAMNCAINPLTALLHCRNGELLERPDALATMRETCAEVAAVMRAEGLAATADELFQQACDTARRTGGNTSSMHADVMAGRGTEIGFLNGFVAARAAAHGIPAPANTRLSAAVTALS